MPVQHLESPFLLVGIAQDADKDEGGFQIPGHIHVIDGDEAGLADGDLAPDGFADRALQEFAHALESQRRHLSKNVTSLQRCIAGPYQPGTGSSP